MSKIKILVAGNDPDCIHHEHINGEQIGTCWKCGQVIDYRRVLASDIDPAMKASHGNATLEQVQQGKSAKYAKRGSANENSAAWAGIRPHAKPRAQLPVKGVGF